ncbi:MAG: hypothetical protein IT374_22565 [Polyangiaceae bacterium]|nr:hypothetical protein [Polyangiaceae bacterium]
MTHVVDAAIPGTTLGVVASGVGVEGVVVIRVSLLGLLLGLARGCG